MLASDMPEQLLKRQLACVRSYFLGYAEQMLPKALGVFTRTINQGLAAALYALLDQPTIGGAAIVLLYQPKAA